MSLLLIDSFEDEGGEPVYASAPEPVELYDAVPGNRGLRGPATILLHLNEPDGVPPSDAAGNLADLGIDGAATMPASVSAWTGAGRHFDGGDALIAADAAGGDTLLQRDVTVQAILSVDIPEGDGAYHTVIARGVGGSTSERRSYELVIQRADVGMGPNAYVFWVWQDEAGTEYEQDVGLFQLPGDGKLFLLTATRRWESTDKVVVRYFIDERLLAEHTSTNGAIGGGTTARTTVGGAKNVATWERFYYGTIDELAVYDYEMPPSEVRAVWRRLYEHQPAGVAMLAGLIPPGAPWLKDPGNKIGRRMKAVGQSLGSAHATIDELRELWLPDHASHEQLARWEKLAGVSPRPRDSLDRRRSRLLGILGREEAFSIPQIKIAVAELLDMGDPEDLLIYEGSNILEDDFTLGIQDERWLRGDVGTWSTVASSLRVVVPAATDIRWESNLWGAHLRTSLDTGGTGPTLLQTTVDAWTLPASSGAGLMLANRRTNDGLWFGLYNDAGTTKIVYRMVIGGVAFPFVALATVATADPHHLRIRPVGAGEWLLQWSATGLAPGDFTEQVVDPGVIDYDWGGFGVFGASSSLASQLTVDFVDFVAFCENGSQPHHWYVFRDPSHIGEPDWIGANKLLQRLKPAHTHAAAIQSLSVLAGEPINGLVNRGPLGLWRVRGL